MSILQIKRPPPSSVSTKTGLTQSGDTFAVHPTPDMFYVLTHPKLWGPSEILVMSTMAINLFLFCIPQLPLSFLIFIFLFWRLAYNLGLGLILRGQSRHSSYTKWIQGLSGKSRGLVYWAVSKSLGDKYVWMKTPVEFNTWIAFRALAMLILANDGWTYVLLAFRCWQPIVTTSMWDYIKIVACIVGGTILNLLCCWIKASAHDCVGDFAWYWGDFFFKIEGSFTMSGVFKFFPHPMYTVGYLAYYGCSLMARSYTLLVVSLTAHLAQIAFLILVEEPHMEKIYGAKDPTRSSEVATSESRVYQRPKEMVGLAHFNIFRSSDFAMAVMLLTTIGTSLLAPVGRKFHIALLLFWWAVHWIGLGTILRLQDTSQFWTKHFEKHGMTSQEAYTHWKRIFNFSAIMSNAAFILAVVRLGNNPFLSLSPFFSAKSLAYFGCGASLILIRIYGGISVHAALGSYGYFYGDFFVPKKDSAPIYSHIYCFTNNAELLLGHLANYGIALIMRSSTVLAMSLGLHVLHLLFVYNVEQPHFRKLYKEHRNAPALQESVGEALEDIGNRLPILRAFYSSMQTLLGNVWETVKSVIIKALVKGLSDAKRIFVQVHHSFLSEKSRVKANFKNSGPYRKVIKITKGMKARAERFQGEDIVKLLERSGVRIEYVDEGSPTTTMVANDSNPSKSDVSSKSDKSRAQGRRLNLRHRAPMGEGSDSASHLKRSTEVEVQD